MSKFEEIKARHEATKPATILDVGQLKTFARQARKDRGELIKMIELANSALSDILTGKPIWITYENDNE